MKCFLKKFFEPRELFGGKQLLTDRTKVSCFLKSGKGDEDEGMETETRDPGCHDEGNDVWDDPVSLFEPFTCDGPNCQYG